MKLFPALISLFFMVASGAAACGGNPSLANESYQGELSSVTMMGYTELIDRLRAAGLSASPAGEVEQPFFSVRGRMIEINGEDVQVFQYPAVAAAAKQAALVSPDGGAIGTSKPLWIEPPHFYSQGRLIVLYVGEDRQVMKALESVLGLQFAGK